MHMEWESVKIDLEKDIMPDGLEYWGYAQLYHGDDFGEIISFYISILTEREAMKSR